MRRIPFALCAAAVLAAAGCSSAYESAALSGAGSMRVEVEVYKGPLGQKPEIQLGELAAVMAETVRSLATWSDSVERRFADVLGAKCSPQEKKSAKFCDVPPIQVEALRSALQGADEIVFALCNIFPSKVLDQRPNINFLEGVPPAEASRKAQETSPHGTPRGDLYRFVQEDACTRRLPPDVYKGLQPPSPVSLRGTSILGSSRHMAPPSVEMILGNDKVAEDLARRVAGIAVEMKSKAFRAADANVFYVPRSQPVRAALANFGLIVSEYSNQIQARLSVLVKQIGTDGRESRLLPVSDYLRDASQTDFLRLFEWLDATVGDDDGMRPGKLNAQARIRMAERLYSDYYWEKINEVYASGQGDVAMAFIKDERGNWDLKSFSNDPTELLASYRGAANAALKTVADLATRTVTGAAGLETVDQAQRLLGLANQIAVGGGGAPATVAGMDIEALHADVVREITEKRKDYEAKALKLQGEYQRLEGQVQQPPEGADPAKLTEKRDDIGKELKGLPEAAKKEIQAILVNHQAVIAAMQRGVLAGDKPSVTSTAGAAAAANAANRARSLAP